MFNLFYYIDTNRGGDDVRESGGGLGYFNSKSLTHFVLNEAPKSINCFSPVNGMLVCSKVTFVALIYIEVEE